jgi:hypothetical protein
VSDAEDRRSRLRALKLQALVREHLGRDVDATLGVYPPGAALVAEGAAWVLAEDEPERSLGPALAWARRQGAEALHLLAERGTGGLARRARYLRFPIEVWHVDGRALLPAVVEPLAPPPAPSPTHLGFADTILEGGAIPVVEHGVLTGEVRGLEVCRVVEDAETGGVRLEVGVGAHDRLAFGILHGDVPTVEALRGVVEAVDQHRRPDAPQHPLNRLVPERMLRWQLEQDPSLLGLREVRRAEPPVPRPNVKDRVPCVALGTRDDGTHVVLVCSVGVDLDLVPYALDARAAALAATPGVDPEGELATWLVVPARDHVPVTDELAGLADQAVSVVSLSASVAG